MSGGEKVIPPLGQVVMDVGLAKAVASGSKAFTMVRHDGLLMVTYRFFDPSVVHKYPIARELRGAIWEESSGRLVSRPFHKFFSIGELSQESLRPFVGAPLRIAEKVDGYLVQTYLYNGEIRHASRVSLRMGKIGAYLKQVWTSDHEKLFLKLHDLFGPGTLLSELVHPSVPVLYPYDEPALVVLAYRSLSGPYLLPGVHFELPPGLSRRSLGWSSQTLTFSSVHELRRFYDVMVAERTGLEGYVLFNGNDFLKLKTRESYVIASGIMRLEELVYQSILEDSVDELIQAYRARPDIQKAIHRVFDAVSYAVVSAVSLAAAMAGLNRKEAYALANEKAPEDVRELVANVAMGLYQNPKDSAYALVVDWMRKRKRKAIEFIRRHLGSVPRPAEPIG